MATSSLPPDSTTTAVTPASSPQPPAAPAPAASSDLQTNAITNSTSSPTPVSNAPPPSTPSATPPQVNSPPPPPAAVVPLPSSSPPPPSVDPPSAPISPPPSAPSPTSSPPPPSAPPPQSPPPAAPPPANSPPPQSSPPPPPALNPPSSPPPPPDSAPPPVSSPPPPSVVPPESSPPPPPSVVPKPAPPPPQLTPPVSLPPPPPPSNHTPIASPPPLPVATHSPPPPPQGSSSSSSGGIGTAGMVSLGAVVGIIILSLAGLFVWCLTRRRKDGPGLNGGYVMPSSTGSSPISRDSASLKQSAPFLPSGSSSGTVYTPTEPGGLGNSRSWFTYEELVNATNGFSSQNLLGEGGFGSVYKGCLPDGRDIAVKQLKIGGGQGEREFKAEVETISRVHHRHLVSLAGYCISESRQLLVYEYVPNNTLHFHLHGNGIAVLDWATRVKIAAGAARGMAYLHEACHPRIIHRDIKSSNILIDNNFEAKVSDFGLAKLALDANTHVTTRVMGTFGYMAPEYASSGKLTEKSDVYSYGVVLLELITGRKPVDTSRPLGDESLVEWARPLLSDALKTEKFDGLVDPRLQNNYAKEEMLRMVEVAAACVRHSAANRPKMGQVVRVFDSLATADLTNGMRVGESEEFNSAEQSAHRRLMSRMAFGDQNYSTGFISQYSLGGRGNTRNSSREQFHSARNRAAASQIEMMEP